MQSLSYLADSVALLPPVAALWGEGRGVEFLLQLGIEVAVGLVVLWIALRVKVDSQRRTEELRASEARYRLLFEHSPVAILEYDFRPGVAWLAARRDAGVKDLAAWSEGHAAEMKEAMQRVLIVGANAAALRLVAAKDLETLQAGVTEIFTMEALAARRAAFLAIWGGRNETEGEFTMHAMDGSWRRVYHHWWTPMINGFPNYERTQLALVDLTEMKSAEFALAAERERLSVTLRAMTEGVITTDTAGAVQFMNEAAAMMTGWLAGEALGHSIDDVCALHHEKNAQRVVVPVGPALQSDRPLDLPAHTMLRSRSSGGCLVEGRCAPMRDLYGQGIGVVLVLRDVTESSRLEAELMRASKLESIGVLAGGIAHDFNNILVIVMGNLALAQMDSQVQAAAGRWLGEAERGALRARDLTRQLLTFAKGGEPLRAVVPLQEVVRESAEFALHGAVVRCEFDFQADAWPADADKGQIGQVVHNLVINALQAMPEGGVLRVSLANAPVKTGEVPPLSPGDYVKVSFADTGIGIAPEHLARVFDPYFTTKKEGTGLGLATAYSVIKKHRGHIAVESAPGRGTTFSLWLPAVRAAEVVPVAGVATFEPMRGRVLFMDDELPIRTMAEVLLMRLGLEVVVVADGAEAVRHYGLGLTNGRPFDAVIMDLTVPGSGMGGREAMLEILKIDPAARGIVSSGYSSDPVMANHRAHGFRAMVPKPYSVGDFSKTLREVLGQA